MKLENQVTSLEISQKLKSLGVKQKSAFFWGKENWKGDKVPYKLNYGYTNGSHDTLSAFTVAELGEILISKRIDIETYKRDEWNIRLNKKGEFIIANTEADARGKMLIYLLENKPPG